MWENIDFSVRLVVMVVWLLGIARLFSTAWTVAHQAPLSMAFPGRNAAAGCQGAHARPSLQRICRLSTTSTSRYVLSPLGLGHVTQFGLTVASWALPFPGPFPGPKGPPLSPLLLSSLLWPSPASPFLIRTLWLYLASLDNHGKLSHLKAFNHIRKFPLPYSKKGNIHKF